MSRSGKAFVRQLNRAYYEVSSAYQVLSTKLSTIRKHVLEDEERAVSKRLKKQDEKRIWDTIEVIQGRGYTEEDAAVLLSALPSRDIIYDMANSAGS